MYTNVKGEWKTELVLLRFAFSANIVKWSPNGNHGAMIVHVEKITLITFLLWQHLL